MEGNKILQKKPRKLKKKQPVFRLFHYLNQKLFHKNCCLKVYFIYGENSRQNTPDRMLIVIIQWPISASSPHCLSMLLPCPCCHCVYFVKTSHFFVVK